MVRFCISKEHMFGINQTTFALAEAGVQENVDNPGEIWNSGGKVMGPVLKLHVGESSSPPPGHLKPQM